MSIKRLICWFISTVALFVAASAMAQNGLETRIGQILDQSALDPDATGVAVISVNRGKVLASVNADRPFNPASCAKIVTAAGALATLGSDYRFRTSFYTDSRFSDGSIKNLYVAGNGDPSLVSEEMARIVSDFAARGITRIHGDIVVDDSFFDGPWYPRKETNDERAFMALTSAISFNFNSAKFDITPGARAGRPAEVATDPPTPYIRIINKVKTGGKFRATITPKESSAEGETFIVAGSIPAAAQTQSFYRCVRDPALYAGNVLKEMLALNGVASTGTVRKGLVSQGATEVIREESKPLSEIVRDMNKFSNNFIAEQITKHLGAVKKGEPGSTAKGVEVLERYIASLDIPKEGLVLENGSGLSEVSRVSPMQLVKLLSAAYRNRSLQPDFVESLSILGMDGTMKKWRGQPHLHGWLRAKTGSLANVSALAGYVPMLNGEIAAFAILSNGFRKGKYSAHDTQLMITSAIAETGR